MYRDDEPARAERARALIDEIAGLERQTLAHATAARRLVGARRELAILAQSLQSGDAPRVAPERNLGAHAVTHVIAFGVAAVAACFGYWLLF